MPVLRSFAHRASVTVTPLRVRSAMKSVVSFLAIWRSYTSSVPAKTWKRSWVSSLVVTVTLLMRALLFLVMPEQYHTALRAVKGVRA